MMILATALGLWWVLMETNTNSWEALTAIGLMELYFSWFIVPVGMVVGVSTFRVRRRLKHAIGVAIVLAACMGVVVFAAGLTRPNQGGVTVTINGVPVKRSAEVVAWSIAWRAALYFGVWYVAFAVVTAAVTRAEEVDPSVPRAV